jgi:exonuclease SbcC
MIFVKSIKIENFQSHKDTYIEFDKGLNVIVGSSDNGKTAVIRAIKWVLYNEPRGINFLRQGEKKVKVTIILSNDFKVTRERTKSKNRYILVDNNENETVFEGFGNEVPLEITKAHGIPKIKIDSDINSIINIGEQLESPFLLSESGAVRAKAIGRLSGVHIIDRAVRNSIKDNRKYSRLKDDIISDLNNVDDELNKYDYLEDYENKIKKLDALLNKIEFLKTRLKTIMELNENFNNNANESKRMKEIINGLKYINECESIKDKLDDKIFRLVNYKFLNDNLKEVICNINNTKKILKTTENLNLAVNNLGNIEKHVFKFKELNLCMKKYKRNKGEYKVNNEKIIKTEFISKTNIEKNLTFKLEKYYNFLSLKKEYGDIFEKINSISKRRDFLKKVDLKDKLAEKIEILLSKYNDLYKIRINYNDNEKSLKEGSKYIKNKLEEIDELLTDYKDILNKMKRCPLCLSNIDAGKIENIINIYREEQNIE